MTTATLPGKILRRPTFLHVLGSEWTKIYTVKSTYWTVLATLVVTIGLSVLLAAVFVGQYDKLDPLERATFDPASWGMIGINFGVLILAVLGVLVITSEYATGMIRTSLTAVPHRARFFAAKALVLVALSFAVGQLAAFISFFLSQAVFSTKDLDASIGDPGMLRAVFGAGLYLTFVPLFAYAIGAIMRHTAGSITTALGVLFVLPLITSFVPGDLGQNIRKFLPSSAGSAITIAHESKAYLSPLAGFTLFLAYTGALLLLAYSLFQQRDA